MTPLPTPAMLFSLMSLAFAATARLLPMFAFGCCEASSSHVKYNVLPITPMVRPHNNDAVGQLVDMKKRLNIIVKRFFACPVTDVVTGSVTCVQRLEVKLVERR